MSSLQFCVVAFFALVCLSVNPTHGANCPCDDANENKCADGTGCTPCCGYEPCRFFCNFCGDRCRGAAASESSSDLSDFQQMDKNSDGFIDKEEAKAHLKSGKCGNSTKNLLNLENTFKKIDKNDDAKLTFKEIEGV